MNFLEVAAILLIILGVAGICADILIIYTIFRFKRLRTAFNVFLANWAISDLCSLVLVPISYGSGAISRTYTLELECLFMQAALIFHVTEILFGIVLSLDWCFAAYFQSLSKKFRKYYRYIIASVWIVTLLFYMLGVSLCISGMNYALIMILFGICYSVNFIFVIVLQGSKFAQKCRKLPISYPKPLNLRLTLITVIILSYLLAVLSMLFMFLGLFYDIYTYIILTGIMSAFAIISSSIVTLILLCCLNYDFRKCLFQLRKPAHEMFDNSASETEDVVRSPHEIVFHTSSQNIITNENTGVVL